MSINGALTVAVSARSLFDLEEANMVFQKEGADAFKEHLRETADIPLEPGAAFPLIKALLKLNDLFEDGPVVDIITASSIHPAAALRVIRSIHHHDLAIKRSTFTGGEDTIPYLKAYEADLLLSRSESDVQQAVDGGMAAAIMYAPPDDCLFDDGMQIRIAFDGDAVLFSDESERIYKQQGLHAFAENEHRLARQPMKDGPFAKVLRTINTIQQRAKRLQMSQSPFRIALVTARGGKAQERPLMTADAWGVEFDESHCLSGYQKTAILEVFRPHIFFDDQHIHVGPASRVVPSARVPYVDGISPETARQPVGEDGCLAV